MSVSSVPENPLNAPVFRSSGLEVQPIVETTDAEDGTGTAYILNAGDVFDGEIENRRDVDWIKLQLEPDKHYVASIISGYFFEEFDLGEAQTNLLDLEGNAIFGAEQTRVRQTQYALNGAEGSSYLSVGGSSQPGQVGTYYTGTYRVLLAELDETSDAPNNTSTRASVSVGEEFVGILELKNGQGSADMIAMALVAGKKYEINLRGGASYDGILWYPLVSLHDDTGSRVRKGSDVDPTPQDGLFYNNSSLTFTPSYSGLYFARVQTTLGNTVHPIGGTYKLSVEEIVDSGKPPIEEVGTSGSDVLLGQEETDDTLIGLGGDDFLYGRAGADRMEGGPGNDTYEVDDPDDEIVEKSGEGRDTVSTSLTAYRLLPNFEALTYDGSDDFAGTGNGASNTITGAAGADTLKGADGNDTISGLGANDKLLGGKGNDALNGDSGNDLVSGNAGNDLLDGGEGDDTLRGGGGDDRLEGGKGADRMLGGGGNDIYIVESDVDVIREKRDKGTDTVETGLSSFTLAAHFENLTFTGVGNFTGNGNNLANVMTGGAGSDVLTGFSGKDELSGENGNDRLVGGNQADTLDGGKGNDVLVGGTGADTMTGGAGNDAYFVDNRRDTVVEKANEGRDTVSTELEIYRLDANVDDLVYLGDAEFEGLGNQLSNQIIGRSGNDTLYGFSGNDRLTGGAGDDMLFGGSGNDVMDGGFGRDVFHFSSGRDAITDFEYKFDKIDLSSAKGIINFEDLLNNHIKVVGEPVVEVPNNQSAIKIEAKDRPADQPVEENETIIFVLTRRDDTRKETAFVSTIADFGFENEGDFDALDGVKVEFEPGESRKEVPLTIKADGETEDKEKFSVFVHYVQDDPGTTIDNTSLIIGDCGCRGVSSARGNDTRNGVIVTDARGNELYIENVTPNVLSEEVFIF